MATNWSLGLNHRRDCFWLVGLVASASLAGCLDHGSANPLEPQRRANLSLNVAGAAAVPRSVELDVFFLQRETGARVSLYAETFQLTPGERRIAIAVDLGPCLAESQNDGAPGCRLNLDVVFRDESNVVIDTQTVGPVLAAAGQTTAFPSVSVREVDAVAITMPDTTFIGGVDTATVAVRDKNGVALTGRPVAWTSADPSIVSVSPNGELRALAVGTTVITAASESKTTARTVTVDSWVEISTGNGQTCGLARSGRAFCWGRNDWGARGTGAEPTSAIVPRPTLVSGGLRFASLATRTDHTCGLTSAGTAYCWGRNDWGQLGVPPASLPQCVSSGPPAAVAPCSNVPVAVSGGLTFRSITVGEKGTCAVTPTNRAYCWGRNTEGQLGIGTTDQLVHSTPEPVAGQISFATLSASEGYACGVSTSGTGYCWGYNAWGALGVGLDIFPSTPTPVAGGFSLATITARGFYHTCGVTTSGQAYCWGRNIEGQLGVGTADGGLHLAPVPVATSIRFSSISTGYPQACGVAIDGAVYCWGSGDSGELGYGSATPSFTPVRVAATENFISVSAIAYRTCGVAVSGAAYCWGSNFGMFGNGGSANSAIPTRVSAPAK